MADTQVFRIVKAIYGLLHAPKRWFESLSRYLKENGWIPHALDQCSFKLLDSEGTVVGVLGLHVDDVLTGGKGDLYDRKIEELRAKYPFGAWQCAQDTTVNYCGREVHQNKEYRIHVK